MPPPTACLQAGYDTKSQVGSLEWTNTSNFGGDGELKITARSVMDAEGIKKMPVSRCCCCCPVAH